MKFNLKALLVGLLVPSLALAAAFPLFQPATGILKGSSTTYVTTAATSADVIALWTGTCNNLRFLRGDGQCNLIDLGANVTGTLPVANGGTNLTASADDNVMIGNGTTWQSKALPGCTDTGGNHLNYDTSTNSVSCGTSAPGGFTGFANPTASVGLTTVNGSAVTAMRSDGAPALSQSIAPTWTGIHLFNGATTGTSVGTTGVSPGTRSSQPSLFLVNSAGAADNRVWESTASTTVLAARVLSDNNSTAANYLAVTRSGATVTDVSLGNATNNPTFNFLGSGVTTLTGGAISPFIQSGSNAAQTTAYDVSGGSNARFGIGTNFTTLTLGSASTTAFTVAAVDMFPATGSFTASFDDACTTTPTVTIQYYKVGRMVILFTTASSGFACTGDSTNFRTTGTPVPAAIRPVATSNGAQVAGFTNNSASTNGAFFVTTAGNVGYDQIVSSAFTGWTASGNRSIPGTGYSQVYFIN